MASPTGSTPQEDHPPLEDVLVRASEAISQRTSRRGFLSKAGRVAFAVLGVAAVEELLPVGRANAAPFPCNAAALCGFCGSQCGCSGCSGDPYSCPGCACIGSFWHACCCTGPGQCTNFRYKDCFKGSCTTTKFNNCSGCQNCCNDQYPDPPGNGPYPGLNCGANYMCTIIVPQGAC